MNWRHASLLLAAIVLFCQPTFAQESPGVSAPVSVRGQILLPTGDLPNSPIRFELQDSTGMLHDLRFTDSNGRFILERLTARSTYTIIVESDGQTWGNTRYEFAPGEGADPRFYLNALPGRRGTRPATISAKAVYAPDPKIVELHDKAMVAYQAGRSEEAEALLKQATNADPKYAIAFNDLGVILMRARRYAEAEPILRKGLEADPKSVTLLVNLGSDLVHANKFAEAILPLREALRLKPDQADAHLQLGVALVETDQLVEGELELMAALNAKGPNDSGVQLYLGKLYARKGDYEKAIQAFNTYLRLAPPDTANGPSIRAAVLKMQEEIAKRTGK
jgi:Flp pilus assembly protein TadD